MSAIYPSSPAPSVAAAGLSATNASLTDPSTWAPPGESASDLWEERSNFVGVVLSSVAYGVHLTLYLFVLHHLIKHPSQRVGTGARARVSWGLVAYITWNFILGTFGIAAEARFNEFTYVDFRNFPGGPNAFVSSQYGDLINMFGTAAYIVLNWSADALVIYRFWLIYNFNYWIALLPCMLLLGSFTMGVILLFQLTQPNANLWTKTTVNFGIPYWSISASLNILVTSLIVGKLFLIRRRTRAVLSTHHSRTYTSVAAMLVESAALYSITALIFIVTYARNSNVQNLVLPVLGQVQAVSPLLIMWRVARGQAISREAMLTSGSAMTPSKLSWRRSYTISTAGGGNGSATSGLGSAGMLDSTFSAPESRAPLPPRAASVYLPPLSKFKRGSGGKGEMDEADSEMEGEWELGERTSDNGDEKVREKERKGERKVRGVEVVVERQVETWESPPHAL
ncbi:uncharacterized protein FOMMEDRAFT_102223 [Fomitiporia mediterranea MF3/22]|uniref:uncharacterized protein n=1 Tax=Fomitiporia mediterranea (strain MF3/22) TaxID=694068 RepID=UPI0004407ED9|nr:uncharacterized protein FOMMEDRAFT_102223 [Fomitiporia mediterranea MF3/22]EJD06440.1 hypothetical protein FOMMEDRAFT_102223 [Fomitiporia mediterranea MF3/22]